MKSKKSKVFEWGYCKKNKMLKILRGKIEKTMDKKKKKKLKKKKGKDRKRKSWKKEKKKKTKLIWQFLKKIK